MWPNLEQISNSPDKFFNLDWEQKESVWKNFIVPTSLKWLPRDNPNASNNVDVSSSFINQSNSWDNICSKVNKTWNWTVIIWWVECK